MQIFSTFILLILLAGCDGLGSLSDTEYVYRAEDYLNQGELQSASIELKNAIIQNPENPQARWLLGKVYIELGDGAGAEKELGRARELGVSDGSVIPVLAKALLLQGKNSEVLELKPATAIPDMAAAEYLAVRGLAYFEQNDFEKASQELDAALLKNPNSAYSLVARARLYASTGDTDTAQEYLNKVFSLDSRHAPAWSLQGDLSESKNETNAAIEAYTKAIDNSYFNHSERLSRALAYTRLNQLKQAQQDIDILKRLSPKHPKVNYTQGVILLRQNKLDEAQVAFELTLQEKGDELRAVFFLGLINHLQGRIEQANLYLERFVAEVPGYIPGLKLLAEVKLRNQEYTRVEDILWPVVWARNEDVEAANILATSLLQQGKTEEAIELLRGIVNLQPESAKAKVQLGAGLLMQGEKSAAYEELEAAIRLDPQTEQADILLVLGHLRERSFDESLQAAESFVVRQPESPVAHNLLGTTLLARSDHNRAEVSFLRARELAPGDPIACHSLAELALERNDTEKAINYYREVLEYHEGHIPTWVKLAQLEAGAGKVASMKAILEQAIETNPDAIDPRILLARYYLKIGKPDQAIVIVGGLTESQRDNVALISVIGEIELNSGNYASARDSFLKVANSWPGQPEPHYLLAKSYAGLGDQQLTEEALKKALELSQDHIQARLALLRLMIQKGDVSEAERHLAILKESLGDNLDILVLEAAVATRAGESDRARLVYENLAAEYPSSNTVQLLSRYRMSTGNEQGGLAVLEEWVDAHPDDLPVLLNLADSYMKVGRKTDAMRLYRQVLRISENNLIALNNLAWYMRESNPEQALIYAEKARKLAPESFSVVDTMVVVLLENGETERAIRFVERGLDKWPGNATLRYRKAVLLNMRGSPEEAENELKALLETESTFPQRNDAENMLSRLNSYQ